MIIYDNMISVVLCFMIGDSEFFMNELIDPMLHRRCYTAIHLRLSAA